MRKNDIISAALNEFSKKSYDNASINTIITESQTSKGTLYHYFKNKEELYLYLADTILLDKIQFFSQSEKHEISQNPKNIFDSFRLQVDKSIDFSLSYPEYTAFILQARKEPNEIMRKKISEKMGLASSDYYHASIKESIDTGVLRRDLPIDFTVRIISYMLTHFLEFLQTMDCELSIENKDFIKEQYRYYISFIEMGLSAK